MSSDEQKQRLAEIKNLIIPFCQKFLNDEYTGFIIKLADKLSRKRTLDITKGNQEIWASAIIYVIARLNFLFDESVPYSISPDTICDFFNTKKSTVGQKATLIEEKCKLSIGDKDFCRADIIDMLTFVQTPEGFIIPKMSLKEKDTVIEIMDEEESAKVDAYLEDQRRQKELEAQQKREHFAKIQRQKAAEKRAKKFKNQGNLFD